MESRILNAAFYKFTPRMSAEEALAWRSRLRARGAELGREGAIQGTILLASEGINASLAGAESNLRAFLAELGADDAFGPLDVKETFSEKIPFVRFLVKIKKEIIPMGRPDVRPGEFTAPRISPRELKRWLDEGRDVALLDTRNEYEIAHGTFRGARHLGLGRFRQFPAKFAVERPGLGSRPVVMFCTGGIRCEKAAALALQEGLREVYQLDGGILRYFEECGQEHYQGSCFVFDQRVAVGGKS